MDELTDFHKEQLNDEQWKNKFDENVIIEIEKNSLIWRGSTAFLGKMQPEGMERALSKITTATQDDPKELFLSILGLSGKCVSGLPCGSIMIPTADKEWAEECFSAKRLFLRNGVSSWLNGAHYDTASGQCAWLNHFAMLWDAVRRKHLKRISTKDCGWLFCVKDKNLTNDAIRLVKSSSEYENLKTITGTQKTETEVLFISWGKLPYDGFMQVVDRDWYAKVKEDSWWKSNTPNFYMKKDNGCFELIPKIEGNTDLQRRT